jgi:hypothetical protein
LVALRFFRGSMLTEAFFIPLHLTLFSQLVCDLLSIHNSSLEEKYKNLTVFFLLNCLLYGSFYLHSLLDLYFFFLKTYFFDLRVPFFLMILSLTLSFFSKNRGKSLPFLISLFLSPYIFFYLFGIERFFLFSNQISGLQLLKAQNPFLTILFSLLLLVQDLKWRWFLCLLILSLLGTYVNNRKNVLQNLSPPYIYSKYVPSEFFLSDDYLLIEEERGIYSHTREIEREEPIYRFTMKPLKNLSQKERFPIQSIVTHMEFPIILKEDSIIYIYDLHRTYRETPLKVVYDLKNGRLKIEGSLF